MIRMVRIEILINSSYSDHFYFQFMALSFCIFFIQIAFGVYIALNWEHFEDNIQKGFGEALNICKFNQHFWELTQNKVKTKKIFTCSDI